MNLVLELAEIEKQVSALISENINLKKENKELTEQNTSLLTSVENLNKSVQELEKENADLKEEINKIAFARGNLEEENAELQNKVDTLQGFLDRDVEFDNLQKENAELKSENQKWKDEWQEQVQKATDEGYARTLQTIQLTKAKEIIKKMLYEYQRLCLIKKETIAEAEQFLSEVEK